MYLGGIGAAHLLARLLRRGLSADEAPGTPFSEVSYWPIASFRSGTAIQSLFDEGGYLAAW